MGSAGRDQRVEGPDRPARPRAGERSEAEEYVLATFGALYASVVVAVVIAILDTDFGRGLGSALDAPARTLIAVPVLTLAAVVFAASLLALVLPASRPRMLAIAGIAGWLIPAWLVMVAVVIGGVAYALHHVK
jgi:hypothetical protein